MQLETLEKAIRPIITAAFTAAFIFGFVAEKIGSDVFVGTATMVIIYWFKSRDDEKKGQP